MTATLAISHPCTTDEKRWAALARQPKPLKVARRLIRSAQKRHVLYEAFQSVYGAGEHVTILFRTRVVRVYVDGLIVQQIAPYNTAGGLRCDPQWKASNDRWHATALTEARRARKRGWLKAARIDVKMARHARLACE